MNGMAEVLLVSETYEVATHTAARATWLEEVRYWLRKD
jgi:hypothetical protein